MNPFKRLLDLFPQQKKFYGTITSINGDLISISLLGGGIISFRNAQMARTFASNTPVWIIDNRGTYSLEQAPQMTSYQLVV